MSKFLKQILAFSLLAAAVTFGLHLNAQSSLKDLKQLQATGSDIMPVGVVLPYNGAAAPTGWLLAQGQCVSQTTYAALYSITGSLPYNTGCGGGLFKVPDYRGRYLRGAGAPGDGNGGDTIALGAFGDEKTKANGLTVGGGTASGTFASSTHSHNLDTTTAIARIVLSSNSVEEYRKTVGATYSTEFRLYPTASYAAATISGQSRGVGLQGNTAGPSATGSVSSTAASITASDSETRPKSYAVNYIIKY